MRRTRPTRATSCAWRSCRSTAVQIDVFSIALDNIVNRDDYTPVRSKDNDNDKANDNDKDKREQAKEELSSQQAILALPKRLNNGVLLSSPQNPFLSLWQQEYRRAYHAHSFDYDSSVVPFKLATSYPDLVHLEMHRLSPISFAFHTARLAEAMACGLYVEDIHRHPELTQRFPSLAQEHSSGSNGKKEAIWYPVYDREKKQFRYEANAEGPDAFMMRAVRKKLLFHLTMSQVRYGNARCNGAFLLT